MHFSILAVLAFLSVSVNAQDLSSLPECASNAAKSGIINSGCGSTDVWCICKANKFLKSLETQIQETCSPDERQETISFAVDICNSVGVTLNPSLDTSGTLVVSSGVTVTAATESAGSTDTASPSSDTSYDTILTESSPPPAVSAFSAVSSSSTPTSYSATATSTPYSSTFPSATSNPTILPPPTNSTNTKNTTNVHTNAPSPFAGIASRSSATWLATSLTLLGAALVAWGL